MTTPDDAGNPYNPVETPRAYDLHEAARRAGEYPVVRVVIEDHATVDLLIGVSTMIAHMRNQIMQTARAVAGVFEPSFETHVELFMDRLEHLPEAQDLETLKGAYITLAAILALNDTPPSVLTMALHSHGVHWGEGL